MRLRHLFPSLGRRGFQAPNLLTEREARMMLDLTEGQPWTQARLDEAVNICHRRYQPLPKWLRDERAGYQEAARRMADQAAAAVTDEDRARAAALLALMRAGTPPAEEHIFDTARTTTDWTDPASDPVGVVAAAAAQLRETALAARRTMDAHDEASTAVEERLAELDNQIAGTGRRIAAAWATPSMMFDQDHTHTWDRDDVQGRPGFACACGKSKCDLLRCVLEQDHEPPRHGFRSDPPLLGG